MASALRYQDDPDLLTPDLIWTATSLMTAPSNERVQSIDALPDQRPHNYELLEVIIMTLTQANRATSPHELCATAISSRYQQVCVVVYKIGVHKGKQMGFEDLASKFEDQK